MQKKDLKPQKTAAYTLRAVKSYQKRHDRLSLILPAGTKERIKKLLPTSGAASVSAFCADAIMEKLEALEENKSDL